MTTAGGGLEHNMASDLAFVCPFYPLTLSHASEEGHRAVVLSKQGPLVMF